MNHTSKMTKPQSAMDCLDNIRAKTDTIAIALSLGKDSIVALDLCYPKFKRIVCFFMYFCRPLEHINRWINYVKNRYPNIEFVEIPHWNLSYILRSGLYCTPQPNIKLIKLADVCEAIRLKYDVQYIVLGMKRADGMNRNLMLKGYKENHYENNLLVYPLAEWNQKDVLSYMKQHRLPEPVRYSLKASSGMGFNVDCFKWLYKNYPQDLLTIYKTFPFSRRILFEEMRKNGNILDNETDDCTCG